MLRQSKLTKSLETKSILFKFVLENSMYLMHFFCYFVAVYITSKLICESYSFNIEIVSF